MEFEELDAAILSELLFDNQEVDDKTHKQYEALLLWVIVALQTGKTTKQIKRYIRSQNVTAGLAAKVEKFVGGQYSVITGKAGAGVMATEVAGGETIAEVVERKAFDTRLKAVRFMARAKEAMKDSVLPKEMLRDEIDKYFREIESMYRDMAKAGRESAYAANDAEMENVRGWMSIAVLDSRTSALCAGLHNQFYSVKEYPTRQDVPNAPPRHPHCRSMLITVFYGKDIRNFKGQNLETFLRRNPDVAREMMGKEKYRLWSDGKAKIDKYIDLKGRRWYRNDEIVKRLGIKSDKRLQPK